MKRTQSCSCGAIEGKKTIINPEAHVGITTKIRPDTGTFIENRGLYVKNNFCPECGARYILEGEERMTDAEADGLLE